MSDYSDIINLEHYQSRRRARMAAGDRAAQFAAFKALTGFEDGISEAARLTDKRPKLSDEEVFALDDSLNRLRESISARPEIELELFVPDEFKEGGRIVRLGGRLRVIDEVRGLFIFEDKRVIEMGNVLKIMIKE